MRSFSQQIFIEDTFSVDPALMEFALLWSKTDKLIHKMYVCQMMMVYAMVEKNRHGKEN